MRLSAVLAVRDEERMLPRCLDLLGFADEIVVVVDARSADATEEVARRYTDRVWVNAFADFSSQKNFAIEQARGEWVLIVDADERITPALAREIDEVLSAGTDKSAFDIETINFFFGRRMDHGGWKEHHTRLVRRDRARYVGDIHEAFPIPRAEIGVLREGMWHFSHRSVADNLVKTATYLEVQAREMEQAGAPRVRVRSLLWVIAKELANRLLYRRGWRDGEEGWIESLYQPFSLFCVHVGLWERQRDVPARYEELERRAAAHR